MIRKDIKIASPRLADRFPEAMDTSPLTGWDNFYVIVGSAAGGLTGLTFVVIALVTDGQRVQPSGVSVFVTPTIVHFASVLAFAAFLSMPHQGLASLSAGLAVLGITGVGYTVFLWSNMPGRGSDYYSPVREDWIFNVILPGLAYGSLALMAALVWRWPAQALYGVAVVLLLLLFVGIHNAWDIAVWTALHSRERK